MPDTHEFTLVIEYEPGEPFTDEDLDALLSDQDISVTQRSLPASNMHGCAIRIRFVREADSRNAAIAEGLADVAEVFRKLGGKEIQK